MTIFRPAAAIALLLSATAMTAIAPPATAGDIIGRAPSLGTPEQLAADRQLVALLADPEIVAVQASLVKELEASPTAALIDGKARIAGAVRQWTGSLIQRVQAADPVRPTILWVVDNTPHSWPGLEVPGLAAAGDNPDHVYRGTFVDGAGLYEISGRIVPGRRPAQFSFETVRGTPGSLVMKTQSTKTPDLGNQVALLTDRDIQVAADGSFTLTVGAEGSGPNHLRTVSGPIDIVLRDVLSDWRQRPNHLSIRRLDPNNARPRDAAAVREQVLKDLPGYVRFWAAFKDHWFGGLAPNTIAGPVARDGNWGYLAAARYRLAPGEAILLRTNHGAARYTGVQVTDPWMVAPDGKRHQTSINSAQAVPDADGGYTYIISPEDPGVANWIDSGGLHEGYILARWQAFPAGAKADGLLREFKVTKLSDAVSQPGIARIDPKGRAAQLALRGRQYAERQQN